MCLSLFLILLVLLGPQEIVGDASSCTELRTDEIDNLPQDKFVAYITDPCRYDKYARPNTSDPLDIGLRVYINYLQAAQAQFTAYLTVEYTYTDVNLKYTDISPSRKMILGEKSLKSSIWTPNLFIMDERKTTVTTVQEKDTVIYISPEGVVTYSHKITVTFFCSMDLRKFPFDSQQCSLTFSDWSYDQSNLLLRWSSNASLDDVNHLSFAEYFIDAIETYDNTNDGPFQAVGDGSKFAQVTITFKFYRDIGFYLLDFFIPSVLLVFTAWVTFWLRADAGPPRATLGASTVIAFITLHLGVTKDIPKVSYVKASDIWFLGISVFIWASLAEFAFVNVIWRRKKIIELKKPKDKYIFKSAVMPSVARKDLRKYESTQTLWTTPSSASLNTQRDNPFNGMYRNHDNSRQDLKNSHSTISIPEEASRTFNWTTMTPQEVAIWVDRKARIVFPIFFFLFNVLYWTFVYVL